MREDNDGDGEMATQLDRMTLDGASDTSERDRARMRRREGERKSADNA